MCVSTTFHVTLSRLLAQAESEELFARLVICCYQYCCFMLA